MKIAIVSILLVLMALAMAILIKLINSKNGKLRKIMIGYFGSEIVLLAGVLMLEAFYGMRTTTEVVLLLCLVPKFIVKIAFYNHIS